MSRILLVEDNELSRDMLSRRLTRRGYEVLTAADGAEAVETARTGTPDLILMEMSLPVIDGWEATRRLKAGPETSGIPIIIVSTKNMETDRVWGLRQGAKDYLVKPPSERELINRINALLTACSVTSLADSVATACGPCPRPSSRASTSGVRSPTRFS